MTQEEQNLAWGHTDTPESKVEPVNFDVEFKPSSPWRCYLFGGRPDSLGLVYTPRLGREPNWFVRWMMKVCFDCLWVKDEEKKENG